jgi:adenylate cyclase
MSAAPGRQIGLRLTLQGLLIATVITSIGAVAFLVNREAQDVLSGLAGAHFRSVAAGAAAQVSHELARVPEALDEMHFVADQHDFDLDEAGDLSVHLLTVSVAFDPGTFIGYASVDLDYYMLARRNVDGASLVEDPTPQVHRHGAPDSGENAAEQYHRRYRDSLWFKTGLASPGITWTPPYRFDDGQLGISAVYRFAPPPEERVRGVFHIDLPLADVAQWLDRVRVGKHGSVLLITADGAPAVLPERPESELADIRALFQAQAGTIRELVAAAGKRDFVERAVDWNGDAYRIALMPIEAVGGLGWYAAMAVPEADFLELARHRILGTVLFGVGAVILVVLLAALVANRVSAPILAISNDIRGIADMQISDVRPPGSMIREVAALGASVERMKFGLRSLERYVPAELARQVMASGQTATFGAERREISIYFSDIEGFTGIAETLDPDRLVLELRDYFDSMASIIGGQLGIVDKFMGDGILALFNAPDSVEDHAAKAAMAAIESVAHLRRIEAERNAAGRPAFRIRIGLGMGDVLVGNIGSSNRFGYTAIGDTVNVASRLEAVNKFYGTRIIGSAALVAAAGSGFEWRRLDRVAVAGHVAGTDIAELLGRAGEVHDSVLAARELYEAALAQYLDGDFAAAVEGFRAALIARPGDKAAESMARRARKLAKHPPDDWRGIFALTKA